MIQSEAQVSAAVTKIEAIIRDYREGEVSITAVLDMIHEVCVEELAP